MAGSIKFSAAALEAFQKVVRTQLNGTDHDAEQILKDVENVLKYEPAFGGVNEGEAAKKKYGENYAAVWSNLSRLKSALEEIDKACTTTLQNYGTTEETNTAKS